MSDLTTAQIDQIKHIIKKHMDVIIMLITGGKKKVDPELVKKLGLPKEISDLITTSYLYGKLSIVQGKDLSNMTVADIDILLKDLKLTTSQRQSIAYLKTKTQMSIDSLQSKIIGTVISQSIQDQLSMYTAVQEVIPEAIEENLDRYEVIEQLREKTQDWERDWHRVATTEMWDAKINGEANAIIDGESPLSDSGSDTIVYKRPSPVACKQCIKHYLEPDGITPKLFKLSDLMANGTNYGKKVADWKPTLGTLHPNCICPLSIMPAGYKFDDKGEVVPVV